LLGSPGGTGLGRSLGEKLQGVLPLDPRPIAGVHERVVQQGLNQDLNISLGQVCTS
jgi:hypothetical protein